MYKISDLIGKKLLDVNSAQDFGTVTGYVFDKTSGVGALVTDTDTVNAEKIFSVVDAVSMVNATKFSDGETYLDKLAYDTTGKYLGEICDVAFSSALKLQTITLDDGEQYGRGKIYAAKDVVLIRAKTPVTKGKSAKPKRVVAPPPKLTSHKNWQQNRKYGDFSFLIGKVTDKTITNFQNEVMIKQGERVNQDTLRQAKISGKLIELCLHAK